MAELSCDSVLVMEFIPNLHRVEQNVLSHRECEEAALVGLRMLYQMIFIDGFIHGDLHPGNVFFEPGPLVVLLDFGLMVELRGKVHKDFIDFFYSIVTNDGLECARIVLDTALAVPRGCEIAVFESAVCELVKSHSGLRTDEFEVARFAAALFEIQRRHGIISGTSFMVAILALLVFEGILKQLYPQLHFQSEARYVLPRARALVYPKRPWPEESYGKLLTRRRY